MSLELMVVEVGGSQFALRVEDVREVFRAVAITPLPNAPGIVEGIVDVRGEVIPVFDVRRRLGMPPVPASAEEHLIAVNAGGRAAMFRADPRTRMLELDDHVVSAMSSLVPDAGTVKGVARLPNGLLLIHDLGSFLTASEAEHLEHALAAERGTAS